MLIIFVAYACLASAFVTNKLLLAHLSPATLTGLRMFTAGFMLVFWHRASPRFTWAHIKPDLKYLLGVALFTTSIPSILKAFALKHMLSFKVSLIWSFDPFITAMYAYLFWHEKLTWNRALGILIAFVGIMGVLVARSPGEEAMTAWKLISYPEVAAMIAMMLGRLGWMIVQYLLRKDRYTPVEVNGLTMVTSGFLTLVVASFFEPIDQVIHQLSSPYVLGLLAFTIVVGNYVGYTIYSRALKEYSATLVSLAGFSYPIFAAILAYLTLGETVSWQFGAAAGVIFVGLLVFNWDRIGKRKKAVRPVRGGGVL